LYCCYAANFHHIKLSSQKLGYYTSEGRESNNDATRLEVFQKKGRYFTGKNI